MLTYSFTNLKNESLYMHLYQCIRQDIVDGKLVSGEAHLPKEVLQKISA